MNKPAVQVRLYPHMYDWRSTAKTNWLCAIALLPVLAFSVGLYGLSAAYVWLSSISAALFSQLLADAFARRLSAQDGSFLITGIIVGALMPPGIALHVPAIASIFAILVAKAFFGGYGKNWINPALSGVAFAYANWPAAMRNFVLPRALSGVDGMSAVTPLTLARGIESSSALGAMDAIHSMGYPLSGIDEAVTSFLNDVLFLPLGARLPEGYIDMIVGLRPGTLGESALLAVLAGSIVLMTLRLIKAEIPLAMIGSFSLLAAVFGTGLPGEELFHGDVLFALTSGGFLFAAVFVATDPVSSPLSRRMAGLYGALVGVLSFVFRKWGGYAEGTVYAILIMNALVPSMERRISPLIHGKITGMNHE